MENDIQHKPAQGSVSFDDNGRPVPTVAPFPELPEVEDLLTRLEEIGVQFPPDWTPAVEAVELWLDEYGDARAAQALHRIRCLLPNTVAGKALDRVIFGESETLRQAAAQVGCNHNAIAKMAASIKAKIGL